MNAAGTTEAARQTDLENKRKFLEKEWAATVARLRSTAKIEEEDDHEWGAAI